MICMRAVFTAGSLVWHLGADSNVTEPLVLDVAPGDLVLLCAQRPHAVRPFTAAAGADGEADEAAQARVSVQSFITHEKGKPLVMDA